MRQEEHGEMLAVLKCITSRELQELGPPFPEGAKARRTKTGDLVVDWSAVKKEETETSPQAKALLAALAGMGLAPRL